jgi:hypothetical protein
VDLAGVAAALASCFGFAGAGVAAFNLFDAGLCEALVALAAGFLAVVLAAVLAADRLATLPDFLAAVLAGFGPALGVFLRVFLDIRLPFVAFGRSIIAASGVPCWNFPRWANLATSEYGYNGFCAAARAPAESALGCG